MNQLPIRPDAPWLAPLAGWSDLPFRVLCREQGAAARETIDIVKLNAEIERIVKREDELRAAIAKVIAEIEV